MPEEETKASEDNTGEVKAEEAKGTIAADEETSKETTSVDGEAEKESAKAEGETGDSKKEEERVVPEKYDLKLPEDSPLSDSAIERISAIAKEGKLTNDEAQSLLDKESSAVKTYVEGHKAKLAETSKEWVALSKADKEIGGDNFKANADIAKNVINKFGSDDLKKGLNETGFGNHPELFRLLVRIGKTMSDDTLIVPGTAPSEKRSMEDVFYGNSEKS